MIAYKWWWVANPTMAMEAYEPPNPAERMSGTLQEVARGKFVLDTIGFLGDQLLRHFAVSQKNPLPERVFGFTAYYCGTQSHHCITLCGGMRSV